METGAVLLSCAFAGGSLEYADKARIWGSEPSTWAPPRQRSPEAGLRFQKGSIQLYRLPLLLSVPPSLVCSPLS